MAQGMLLRLISVLGCLLASHTSHGAPWSLRHTSFQVSPAESKPPQTQPDGKCPVVPVPVPLRLSDDAKLGGGLDSLISRTIAGASLPPGVAYAVRYGDDMVMSGGKGVADKDHGTQVTAKTLFRIGSTTKVFPALLTCILASKGYLSLDDPIVKHVPGFSLRDPWEGSNGSAVTFRHILAMRSGIQREIPAEHNTTEAALRYLSTTYMIMPAGASPPAYSNAAFALLGRILPEYVVKGNATLHGLVEEHIINPLGLRNTGFDYTPEVTSRLAKGYVATGDAVPFADIGWMEAAGAMYSNVEDLTELAHAIMRAASPSPSPRGPSLAITPTLARQLLDVTYWAPDGRSMYGVPWEVRVRGSYQVLHKGGNLPGYTSMFSFVPELRASVVMLWNGGQDEVSVGDDVYDVLIPSLTAALSAVQPPPLIGPRPEAYVGTYSAVVEGRHLPTLAVIMHESKLVWGNVYLDHIEGDAFRAWYPQGSFPCLLGSMLAGLNQTVLFERDEAGRVNATSMPGWAPGIVWTR